MTQRYSNCCRSATYKASFNPNSKIALINMISKGDSVINNRTLQWSIAIVWMILGLSAVWGNNSNTDPIASINQGDYCFMLKGTKKTFYGSNSSDSDGSIAY